MLQKYNNLVSERANVFKEAAKNEFVSAAWRIYRFYLADLGIYVS